jgi:putative FmdB family regulatory protein
MPTYEYECEECNIIMEKFFSFKDRKETVQCDICGKESNRIMSNVGISIPNPVSDARRGRGNG